MLACIAYYTIGHACTKDQVPPEITESTAVAIDALKEGSYEIGQMLGMTDDAMTSRLRMHARRFINESCINFSSLLSRMRIAANEWPKVLTRSSMNTCSDWHSQGWSVQIDRGRPRKNWRVATGAIPGVRGDSWGNAD